MYQQPIKFVGLLPTTMITKLAKDMKAARYEVEKSSNTLVAKLDGHEVARALKGPGGRWILRANPDVVKPENS